MKRGEYFLPPIRQSLCEEQSCLRSEASGTVMQLQHPGMTSAQSSLAFSAFPLECAALLHPLFTPQVFSTKDNNGCSFADEVRYCVALSE